MRQQRNIWVLLGHGHTRRELEFSLGSFVVMCGQTSVPWLQLFLKTYLLWKKKSAKFFKCYFWTSPFLIALSSFLWMAFTAPVLCASIGSQGSQGSQIISALGNAFCLLRHSFPSRLVFSGEAELPSICAVSSFRDGSKIHLCSTR